MSWLTNRLMMGAMQAPRDPYWSDVALLLRTAGGSPVDASTNGLVLSAVRNGFPDELAGDSPYPASAGFPVLNFGDDDGIRLPSTPALQFGTNDFTIEFWMKADTAQEYYATIVDSSTNNTGTGIGVGNNVGGTAGKVSFFAQGQLADTEVLVSQSDVLTNVWVHVACVRYGASGLLFVNGVLEASTASWGSVDGAYLSGGEIGGSAYSAGTNGDNNYTGLLADFRVTNGVARYMETVSVPVVPYPTW